MSASTIRLLIVRVSANGGPRWLLRPMRLVFGGGDTVA